MTLVIMAAGIGSRFGEGIKQLQTVDDNGHIIMDYSIHDAIQAGFNKIVLIIRKDIEKDFKEVIGVRIENICKELNVGVSYVYQDVPKNRTKPYGTGHAVLACKDVVNEPFAVINADDYYGKNAFKLIYNYFNKAKLGNTYQYCLVGFVLKNTLSENGGVTRGICEIDTNSYLTRITETKNIIKDSFGVNSNGIKLDENSLVSMNMWGFTPDIFDLLSSGFVAFLNEAENENSEFLIPIYIGELLHDKKVSVNVLESNDKWFGMTYKEDIPTVIEEFNNLKANGSYGPDLYDDLCVNGDKK